MYRKSSLVFRAFIMVAIFSLVFMLFAGCGIFGGGKKEEKKPKAEAAPEKVSKAPEEQFKSGELDVEIKTVNGSLNWSKGFIQAKGYGLPPDNITNEQQRRLMAFRAAYADALSQLLEITAGVQVTSTTTVKDFMTKDNTVELKVQGIIKGARELAREYNAEEKTAVVQLGIYLEEVAKAIPEEDLPEGGALKFYNWEVKKDTTLYPIVGDDKVLAETIKTSTSLDDLKKKLEEMAEENRRSAEQNQQLLARIEMLNQEIAKLNDIDKRSKELGDYTGIVVNAAGSDVKPAMKPSIYYKSGDETKILYGSGDGRDKALESLAGWVQTLIEAINHDRVTQNPLVVNAQGVSDENCAFIIATDDAELIKKIDEQKHLLENCSVVIIH